MRATARCHSAGVSPGGATTRPAATGYCSSGGTGTLRVLVLTAGGTATPGSAFHLVGDEGVPGAAVGPVMQDAPDGPRLPDGRTADRGDALRFQPHLRRIDGAAVCDVLGDMEQGWPGHWVRRQPDDERAVLSSQERRILHKHKTKRRDVAARDIALPCPLRAGAHAGLAGFVADPLGGVRADSLHAAPERVVCAEVGQDVVDGHARLDEQTLLLAVGIGPAPAEAVNVKTEQVGEIAAFGPPHQFHEPRAFPAQVRAGVLFLNDQPGVVRGHHHAQRGGFLAAQVHLGRGALDESLGLLFGTDTRVDRGKPRRGWDGHGVAPSGLSVYHNHGEGGSGHRAPLPLARDARWLLGLRAGRT